MVRMATLSFLVLVGVCAFFVQASAERRLSQAAIGQPGHGAGVLGPYRRCGRHEVFKNCVSSTCSEAKCWKPRVGPICTADCRSGCFCRRGFFRDRWNRCVSWNNCNRWGWDQQPFYPSYPEGWVLQNEWNH
uniref:Putative tick til 11 n=1 Tax=Amblyomma aureolatum TaxID=187763 RepID=A0A1E1WXZ8_9ACAR